MKQLFLTSSFAEVADKVEDAAGDSLKGRTVAFIATANLPEKSDWYVRDARKAFANLGCRIDELEISTADQDTIRKSLEEDELIYLSGGNTFFLLQELQKTGTGEQIKDQVNRGKLYIGESAGSVVTGPDIAYLEAMDPRSTAPDLTSTEGLNLVDFHPLPHYTEEPFAETNYQIIEQYRDSLPIVAITNSQVIRVCDRCLTIL